MLTWITQKNEPHKRKQIQIGNFKMKKPRWKGKKKANVCQKSKSYISSKKKLGILTTIARNNIRIRNAIHRWTCY